MSGGWVEWGGWSGGVGGWGVGRLGEEVGWSAELGGVRRLGGVGR